MTVGSHKARFGLMNVLIDTGVTVGSARVAPELRTYKATGLHSGSDMQIRTLPAPTTHIDSGPHTYTANGITLTSNATYAVADWANYRQVTWGIIASDDETGTAGLSIGDEYEETNREESKRGPWSSPWWDLPAGGNTANPTASLSTQPRRVPTSATWTKQPAARSNRAKPLSKTPPPAGQVPTDIRSIAWSLAPERAKAQRSGTLPPSASRPNIQVTKTGRVRRSAATGPLRMPSRCQATTSI